MAEEKKEVTLVMRLHYDKENALTQIETVEKAANKLNMEIHRLKQMIGLEDITPSE